MKSEKKIAVLDITPNSAAMLLATINRTGHVEIINEFGALTRLTDKITEHNTLPQDVIKSTVDICEEMVNIAYSENVDKVIILATSAIKQIVNKSEFLAGCHSRFNIFPHLLSPSEEANYTFNGATADYFNTKNKPIIVVEVGESTAEIIFGTKDLMVDVFSIRLGSLYLSHLYKIKNTFLSKLYSPLRSHISKVMESPANDIHKWLNNRKPVIICVGNTATTYAAIKTNQGHHSRNSLNDTKGTTKSAKRLARKMGKMDLRSRKIFLDSEYTKADYIHIGMYTMSKIISNLGFQNFSITTNDLKIGFIKSIYGNPENSI